MSGRDGNNNNNWGLPPPSPFFSPTTGMSMGETSAQGARNSMDGMSMSGASNGIPPGKRRRESEAGSMEPDDDRPLAITCAPCRSRKIKCDSRKPTCANCVKSPAECYYPVKLKPGLRPGTGTDMVKRLEQLEERVMSYEARLSNQEQRLSQVQLSSMQTPTVNTGMLNNTVNTTSFPTPGTSAISLGLQDFTTQGPPSNGPPSGGMSGSYNPPSGGGMMGIDMAPFAGPSASPSGISVHSFTDPRILPPDDVVRDLIALFFSHVHPWAPIISLSDLPSAAPWNIVVHALVVLTLRYSTDPRVIASKDTYRSAAKTHVLAHAIESTSLSSVQALTLLAVDLIGSDQGPSSWGILALLTRSAVHLGLAREEESSPPPGLGRPPAPSLSKTSIIGPPSSWHEDESRRRLFWMIFCLDRYACVSTGWDFALPDFEIKRRLPCADDIWQRQDWYFTPLFRPVLHRDVPHEFSVLSPLAALVEALDLLGRAHTLQSQTIEPGDSRAVETRKDATMTLSSAARRWFSERNWDGHGVGLTIQAIHHATLLKLNAYYAFPALSNGEPQEPYTSTCLASCRAVVALTESARMLGWQDAATPLFIWGCWVAARVLFVHAFLSHQFGPDEDFETILRALREMASHWGLANQYIKLLDRAKRKWIAAHTAATTTSGNDGNLPDAIHVLLDLRRTAYSAVNTNINETPQVSPPDLNLSHLPAWAVQPLLGDLHSWFDLPAGIFQNDM